MSKQKGFISGKMLEAMMFHFAFVFLAIGFVAGFMAFVGIPWLWQYIKPFIHSMTA